LAGIQEILATSPSPDRVVVWAIAATAFFRFFRSGELLLESATAFNPVTSLEWGDVAVDNHGSPQMVQVHIKKSKVSLGADIVVGTTGLPVCSVMAILDYVQVRGDRPGPFFLDSDGKTIIKSQTFVMGVRDILRGLGLPQDQYSGHSFRIGAATTAATAGVEDSTLQILGCWHSSAFLQYIRTPKEHLAALTAVLAGPTTPQPSA